MKKHTSKQNATFDIATVDIAIVGGGMVGSALALALRESPFSIALVEAQGRAGAPGEVDAQNITSKSSKSHAELTVDQFEARVSALTPASKKLLEQLSAWQQISLQKIMSYQKMNVWDELGTAKIDFDAAELYCTELGFIVENRNVVVALHKQLEEQNNLTAYWESELDTLDHNDSQDGNNRRDENKGHRLVLRDGRQIHCNLLVAADGANSKVRNLTGMTTREWDYQHHAIVATVQTELAHGAVARQRFSESGPLAFLPLQDSESSEKFCSIVWSLKPDLAAEMMSLDDTEFAHALSSKFESRLGAVISVSKRFSFPLRQRHAKSYVGSGVVLVGDAAHTIHPLAGQGVNLGFKDVQALSQVLLYGAVQGCACNDKVLLKRFQRQRQGDNLMMMGLMEGFKQLFEQKNPLVRWVRNAGLNWVDKQSVLKNQIVQHAMGLSN